MYKKITHTIVEEHFDRPMAAHIKDLCECPPAMKASASMAMQGPVSSLDMQKVYTFRTAARGVLGKYFWRTRSLLVSILDNASDQEALKTQLGLDIDNIGAAVAPYYGDAGSALAEKLTACANSLLGIITAIKDGKDYTPLKATHAANITELATFLSSANPENWPATAVTAIFTELTNAFVEQAVARKDKVWLNDFAALERAQQVFMTSPTSFSDVFVNGIVNQFPDKFTTQ